MATPSSSTVGFFQAPPVVPNQFHDNISLNRALSLFMDKDGRNYKNWASQKIWWRFLKRTVTWNTLGSIIALNMSPGAAAPPGDPAFAWTTGQWMTEGPSGSDVSGTEILATYNPDSKPAIKASDGSELGPWRIDGFKWFSSATDANMMTLLTRTPKGISTFLAPMRRFLLQRDVLGNDTELNGVHIQRLKNKLGTRALPTAELELKDVRGWLVGEDG
ncbi:acyl-CoA dehydrogenase/oxidase [Xylaria digitata]|nr:acyl-CoA dehydrogenase/oxidase [Xylaria digitata]